MGLYDRIERRAGVDPLPEPVGAPHRGAGPPAPTEAPPPVTGATSFGAERHRPVLPLVDPVAGVRRRLQQALVETLGPQLYEDIGGDDDLAHRVQETIVSLLAREETPLAGGDRARIANWVQGTDGLTAGLGLSGADGGAGAALRDCHPTVKNVRYTGLSNGGSCRNTCCLSWRARQLCSPRRMPVRCVF